MRSDVRFFIDRGLGSRIVPDGLRDAGWVVETMDGRYGADRSQSIADTEWIRDAARAGDVIVTKDKRIAKNILEAEAIWYSEARVLTFPSAQMTGLESCDRLLANGARIERLLSRGGPWVYAVHVEALMPIRLNYPPG